jgi:predicted acyltransferase
MTGAPPSGTGGRLVALDAFRGATIAAMILVNNPGSWAHVYAPLRHADWHGCTPTDLIFPFFLFIVGVAIPLAFAPRLAAGASRPALAARALRRGATLVLLGLGIAAYPFVTLTPVFGMHANLADLRVPGVLQRIGVCYVLAAWLALFTRGRTQALVLVACLLGYQALLLLVPVQGGSAGQLDAKAGNLAAWVDRAVFGERHLWKQSRTWDPEGLLGTIPALATCLFGVACGRVLLAAADARVKCARLAAAGAVWTLAGWTWGLWFPLNKSLWTSSYATFTAGLAAIALAALLYAVDVRGWRRPARPLVAYGVNAITVFVGSALLARTLQLVRVRRGDGSVALSAWVHETLFAAWLPPKPASLAYALAWIAGWYAVLAAMARRGILWKV